MSDISPPTSINVRLKPELAQALHEFNQANGITATDLVRLLLTRALTAESMVPADEIQVKVEMPARNKVDDDGWVGKVIVRVTVPQHLQAELSRLVFVLPEFTPKDPRRSASLYHLDNSHYLRITTPRLRVGRKVDPALNVLSFRLLDGVWSGSLWCRAYDVDYAEMMDDVRQALEQAFRRTLRLHLAGALPSSSLMSDDEYTQESKLDEDFRRPPYTN